MKQYFEIKQEYADALVLFQVGDFYELFFEDAKRAAAFLGITLTKRGHVGGEPIPLCGVPVHALDHYLFKLVRGGFKVAICDQLEEAVPGKVVRRGIKQVLTPGTLTDSKLLNEKSSSYLLSFFPTENSWGMFFGELLTAKLFATLIPAGAFKLLEAELTRFYPDEILVPDNKPGKKLETYLSQAGYLATMHDFQNDSNQNNIQAENWVKRFHTDTVNVIQANEALMQSAYGFYSYLNKNQQESLDQFNNVTFYKPEDFLVIDAATQKNLELIKNNRDGSDKNTLFGLMDGATTSQGSRMIKRWLARPLIKPESIIQRQNAVELFVTRPARKEKLIELLKEIGDFERVVGRISLKRGRITDYLMITNVLRIIPEIKNILQKFSNIHMISAILSELHDLSILGDLLNAALNNDPDKNILIKSGYDSDLDRLRDFAENSNNKILEFESSEQKSTGIGSLKVGYNRIHGYYIEITKTNLSSVPANYIRYQTLTGKERYITPELQKLQIEIEKARNEVTLIDEVLFEKIKNEVQKYINSLRRTANALSTLDAILGFARVAYENGYAKPEFNDSKNIKITAGRNPIVEKTVVNGFVPNCTDLTDQESLWIITGPNMGGKSTYLRQVALISIMAQCGMFVPAKSASLPILDRIFSRIGAGDNLAEGKSTFLVEMEETATICTQATDKSLVILDEVGRGTSTFDGLAIAQAVVEYIVTHVKARCLFATHYHELTDLQNKFSQIASYHTSSLKTETGIVFLHKIIKGTASGSFGLEVAKLANLPPEIILRAAQILEDLNGTKINKPAKLLQANLFAQIQTSQTHASIKKEAIFNQINKIDFDELSPKKSFDLLWKIKELL